VFSLPYQYLFVGILGSIEIKIVNWLIDITSKAEHSLYSQWVCGARRGTVTEDCLPCRCSETQTAVNYRNVTSGPPSPDAVSVPPSPGILILPIIQKMQWNVEENEKM